MDNRTGRPEPDTIEAEAMREAFLSNAEGDGLVMIGMQTTDLRNGVEVVLDEVFAAIQVDEAAARQSDVDAEWEAREEQARRCILDAEHHLNEMRRIGCDALTIRSEMARALRNMPSQPKPARQATTKPSAASVQLARMQSETFAAWQRALRAQAEAETSASEMHSLHREMTRLAGNHDYLVQEKYEQLRQERGY